MRKEKKDLLWYKNSAQEWIQALPLGNGRLGAMVYGGGEQEKIQIDESSFWSGEASADNNRPGTKELMDKIRGALLEKDFALADELGHDFIGNKNQYGTNMPVGELKLQITDAEYKTEELVRYLDLRESMAGTEVILTKVGEEAAIHVKRECFISNPAQVFVLRMSTDQAVSMTIRFDGIGNNTRITGLSDTLAKVEGDALESLHSNGKTGVHMEGCMKLVCDGEVSYQEGSLFVGACTELTLFMDMATTMFRDDPFEAAKENVMQAAAKGYAVCREEHVKDVQRLFGRMDVSFGQEEKNEIPTDMRIAKMAAGDMDTDLCALMYQYGRYLLIASSREDSPLPTHMGGIWNDNIYNNIDCTQDMHIDMNLQMQYWASAMCNLPECYQPFFRYVEEVLMPSGAKTAKEAYEAEGWTAHVVSNPWGFTSLGWAYNWGAWSLGGAWCAAMVLDYYEYTGDRDFLENRGLAIVEGAVRFVLDYVFWDEKNGYYMTGPSYSPENQFAVDGKNYFLSLSNTCDVLLVRELLENYEKICGILGKKTQWLEKSKEVVEKLPPYQIGKKGQIQEWFYDFDEPIPNHRHTSHLLGLYPFGQILPERDKALEDAARRSIALRHEDFEITSWGMNMLLGYYARLGEGQKAQEIIQETFSKIVRTNMASVMSDGDTMWMGTWELDGNTGMTAAMTELLIQSRDGEVMLLPALPPQWENGHLTGVRLKYCGSAEIYWKNGILEKAVIHSERDGEWKFIYEDKMQMLTLRAGEDTVLLGEMF